MSDSSGAGPAGAEQPPLTVLAHSLRMAPMPSPKQMVSFYDPDQFEEFVKEWVPALDTKYVLVERHGGSGDHGVDVAGYLSRKRLEGQWHNYQCKRYTAALSWGTAAGEIRKMFVAAAAGAFTVPTRYVFVAPIISRSLPRQFAKPTECRTKFLQELSTTRDKLVTALTDDQRRAVADLAADTDFAMFECVDLDEMIELHKNTPHYVDRFPYAPFGQGPRQMVPPPQHREDEARYVQHLVDVYREHFPSSVSNLEDVPTIEEASEHLKRQREAFYAAESVRVFARDATHPAYFERVKKDVYDIVVEVAARSYPDGWERHGAVMAVAGALQLTPTVLTPFVETNARKGVCHHLANEDRLTWCREGEK